MTKLKIKIDGHEMEMDAKGGSATILEAARLAGIHIPTLCHHPSIKPYGSCRLCTVQIVKNGRKKFVTACNYPVEDGLVVITDSAEVADIRKMILELLIARCGRWPENMGFSSHASCRGIKVASFADYATGSAKSWWASRP